MDKILIVGSGGLATGFLNFFSDSVDVAGVWVSDSSSRRIKGYDGVYFDSNITPDSVGTEQAVIAIGSTAEKERHFICLRDKGFKFPTIVHPNSIVSNTCVLSEGAIISPSCVLSANTEIGLCSYVNFMCGIGHDAKVGNFVQVNPGAQLAGFTSIGNKTLVGSNVSVLQGVEVGESATLGSGSAVYSRVLAGTTVIGNPAKRMKIFEKN